LRDKERLSLRKICYKEVNRGSTNRTGWNSIIGSFVISKSPNNVRIIEEIMRCDDATNRHWRGRYKNFGKKYPKKSFILEIFSQTEEHKHNIPYKSGDEYVARTHPA
jgi:hypothetical protein